MIIPDIHLIFDSIFDLILFNLDLLFTSFHIGTPPEETPFERKSAATRASAGDGALGSFGEETTLAVFTGPVDT